MSDEWMIRALKLWVVVMLSSVSIIVLLIASDAVWRHLFKVGCLTSSLPDIH